MTARHRIAMFTAILLLQSCCLIDCRMITLTRVENYNNERAWQERNVDLKAVKAAQHSLLHDSNWKVADVRGKLGSFSQASFARKLSDVIPLMPGSSPSIPTLSTYPNLPSGPDSSPGRNSPSAIISTYPPPSPVTNSSAPFPPLPSLSVPPCAALINTSQGNSSYFGPSPPVPSNEPTNLSQSAPVPLSPPSPSLSQPSPSVVVGSMPPSNMLPPCGAVFPPSPAPPPGTDPSPSPSLDSQFSFPPTAAPTQTLPLVPVASLPLLPPLTPPLLYVSPETPPQLPESPSPPSPSPPSPSPPSPSPPSPSPPSPSPPSPNPPSPSPPPRRPPPAPRPRPPPPTPVAGLPGGGTLNVSAVLELHNNYRALHNTPPMTWSQNLAAFATAWASNCYWGHSMSGYGENMAIGSVDPSTGINQWYAEGSLYNYNNPGYTPSTGHFTQVVWHSSSQVGCALAPCSQGILVGERLYYNLLVCEYDPPGNLVLPGQFAANVLPPVSP